MSRSEVGGVTSGRRNFIRLLATSAAVLPFAPGLAARLAPPAAAAAIPEGGFFLVNGWVLTRADLAALDLDAH